MASITGRRWPRRLLVATAALLMVSALIPWWCGRRADALFDGDRATVQSWVDWVADETRAHLAEPEPVPDDRFGAEWWLVSYQMAALGLGQFILAHPETRARYASTVTRAALMSSSPRALAFGKPAWGGEGALDDLDGEHGHAYVSYSALAVSMARLVDPHFPAAEARAHDRLIVALARRLGAAPHGLIETYPGESYPTDCAAVAGAIALHGRATQTDYTPLIARWVAQVRRDQIHAPSGYVWQRMDARTGAPRDVPRGSGTGLGTYFAGFADAGLAKELGGALVRHQGTFLGFGGQREFAPGFEDKGHGDVDSGPVILGISVSGTGFALAPARAFGHRDAYRRLMRTATLFGVPWRSDDRLHFVSGQFFGNALLLALATSGPEIAP